MKIVSKIITRIGLLSLSLSLNAQENPHSICQVLTRVKQAKEQAEVNAIATLKEEYEKRQSTIKEKIERNSFDQKAKELETRTLLEAFDSQFKKLELNFKEDISKTERTLQELRREQLELSKQKKEIETILVTLDPTLDKSYELIEEKDLQDFSEIESEEIVSHDNAGKHQMIQGLQRGRPESSIEALMRQAHQKSKDVADVLQMIYKIHQFLYVSKK